MAISLEVSLRESTYGLGSVRATERKKCAENIKTFLSLNAVPNLLTENSMHRKGYTWNNLFDDIHEYILKETEKFESSKTFYSVTAPLCTSLLHLCVAGSNKGKVYIKCDKLTGACLFILGDKRLTTAIGDAYLNLLHKYILSCDYYLKYITPNIWEELLDVCITVNLTNYCKIDDLTKLKLIWTIISNARRYCQFVIPVRNSILRIKKGLHKYTDDKKVREMELEITIVLLEMLSSEYRLTMCNFTETVLMAFLKAYDQNGDQKKKASLFKLIQLTLMLHHPQGRTQNDQASLAYDWDTWNKHLHSIMEIICTEINYTQKFKMHKDNNYKSCPYFSYVTASVYFQMFNLSSRANENEAGSSSSSKRQKTETNKNRSFYDLIEELRQHHVPWLGVIQMYITNYRHSVSNKEFLALISVIEFLITNRNSNNLDWAAFKDVACLSVSYLIEVPDAEKTEYEAVLLTLWNSCVRNSALVSPAHHALHSIAQLLLSLNILTYQNVQPVVKLYHEKGMPVTDSSVKTLCSIFFKYFTKCSNIDLQRQCFEWLVHGELASVDVANIRHLMIRLIASENVDLSNQDVDTKVENLHDILFNSIDKSILFGEFELDISNADAKPKEMLEILEINEDTNRHIDCYFQETLLVFMNKMNNSECQVLEYTKFTNVVLNYFDVLMRCKLSKVESIKNSASYITFRKALKLMYISITKIIKDNLCADKVVILELVKTMFMAEHVSILNEEVRSNIDSSFFMAINVVLNTEDPKTADDIIFEDEEEVNPSLLKHTCIYVLAAYCRKLGDFREQLLNVILDPTIYDFKSSWDVECAFQCIKLIHDPDVEKTPLETLFFLMQNMCKELYRDSEGTFGLLLILVKMLDSLWSNENTRQNCLIMVKGYLQRCQMLFYPPHVAALVYECVAKIASFEHHTEPQNAFREAVVSSTKGNIHNLRLHSCYLLTHFAGDLSEIELDSCLEDLLDIFTLSVPDSSEQLIKDESANRTLSLLHSFYALANSKKSLLHEIVKKVIHVQNEKSFNKTLVKKVLNKITLTNTLQSIDTYLNANVLSILHFWFSKNNSLVDLPLYLFGYDRLDSFLEVHSKWLIPVDILWRKQGNVHEGEVLKRIQTQCNESVEKIIEMCFNNIIVLCLPYIVIPKYGLDYTSGQAQAEMRKQSLNADKMFQLTRQILKNEKWTDLFIENMGELVLMAATHLRDHNDAKMSFEVDIPRQNEIFFFPETVFDAILKYFGELIDEDIMQYLCENQPLAIFKILFKLWGNVLQEKIFEFKVLNVHTFATFVRRIPLGLQSDAFVCNYTCNSITHAIKSTRNKDEIKVLVSALRQTFVRFLPTHMTCIEKSLAKMLSTLIIKREEGFATECSSIIDYLSNDVKDLINENRDFVDFHSLTSASQREKCATMIEFLMNLKTYRVNLKCPSHENLNNLCHFLKFNKKYINGFADDMEIDTVDLKMIHGIINMLTDILKSSSDNKTKIEACNCLAEIGTYDLKALVTVPPEDNTRVVNVSPKQYFSMAVVKSLLEVVYDENPNTANKVVVALNDLLKYFKGGQDLDISDLDKLFLKPLSTTVVQVIDFRINIDKFSSYRATQLWIPLENESHLEWLKRTTTSILDIFDSTSTYIETLREVCVSKPNVCKKILPPLVGLLLSCATEKQIIIISEQVNGYFQHIWDMSFDSQLEVTDSPVSSDKLTSTQDHNCKSIIRHMLDVVNFVRLQSSRYKPRKRNEGDNLNYLKVDYDKVSWAATVVDESLTAIYYSELWTAARNDGVPPSSPEDITKLEGGDHVQRILRKCYVSLGELDALAGCGTAHLAREGETRKHLIGAGRYVDALLAHDVALSCAAADRDTQRGVVECLHKAGMHHLALQYIKSMAENDDIDDIKYDCLAILGDWSVIVDTAHFEEKSIQKKTNPRSIIKAFRYACLKDCINLRIGSDYEKKITLPINRAKLAVAGLCQNLNLENCQNVYKVVGYLHLFNDIEDYYAVRCDELSMRDLLARWAAARLPPHHDFKHVETLLSQRNLILDHAAKTQIEFSSQISSLQLKYAELGLSNQRIQMAQRILATVKKLHHTNEVALVESRISWAKGHNDVALSLVRNIVSTSSPDDKRLNAISLRQLGIWMAESKCENARDIINKYLQKSLDILPKNAYTDTRLKVYFDIATFADEEYKKVVTYMNSSIFEKKMKCMANMKDTASSFKATKDLTKDELKALQTNARFSAMDEAEIANTKAEKERFLHLAMKYYLLSLQHSEERNLSVFRVISLWLDNDSVEFSEDEGGGGGGGSGARGEGGGGARGEGGGGARGEGGGGARGEGGGGARGEGGGGARGEGGGGARGEGGGGARGEGGGGARGEGEQFARLLHAIPSRKFVAVLPQLAPRLAADDTAFMRNLKLIIERCAIEHPHHTLPILFSLKNSVKDKLISTQASQGKRARPSQPAPEPRVAAADRLLRKLANENTALRVIIDQMEILCDAEISIANYVASKSSKSGQRVQIPAAEPLRRVRQLDALPVPVVDVPVRHDCNYSHLTTLASFDDHFELVGGINCPKKIICRSSDGRQHTMLIKGQDDLRQDAVMQQVFTIVNTLLEKNTVTKRSNLLIRTYKVVPLSRRSGVLQWCEGTLPLGAYLAGAHARHRPQDISCSLARSKLNECHKSSNQVKLAVFASILRELRPVFHCFFTEHYHDPVTWYERRLAYTKSVAASSMVGYILGLGDRHVQNILIDEKTAEVIHIDFGIAFDQGKTLPTPETIPFRLTQDMIAGFGSSGVEGIFRKSCEKTMQLLRDNQETLLTILRVLLCDPLYSWTVTTAQQNMPVTQTTGATGDGSLAERALLTVRSKLNGTEGGVAGGVAVPGQVAHLIQTATDPANLCRLFPGWQPYL